MNVPEQRKQPGQSGQRPAGGAGDLLAKVLGGKAPSAKPTRVVVGLDYGTCWTKAILYVAPHTGATRRVALDIFGAKLLPSIVGETSGQVIFGEAASRAPMVHRSLKMRLRKAALEQDLGRCAPGSSLPVAALVWGFLSRAVDDIQRQVDQAVPERDGRKIEWHLGVPLAEGQEPLEQAFADMLFRAVHGPRGVVREDMPASELLEAYRTAARVPTPAPEHSDCLVFAEAAVAVNAVQLRRGQLEDGKYFVCDVGAGSLDTAFFWYGNRADRPINFYGTSCRPVGGDAFFEVTKEIIRKESRTALGAEALHTEAERRLHRSQYRHDDGCFKPVLERCKRGRSRAFGLARRKEQLARWEDEPITGFLVGGGAKMPGVRQTCLGPLETGVGDRTARVHARELELVDVSGATPLHWIASGLSIPVHEFEPYYPPEDVDPVADSHEFIPSPFSEPYE